MREIPIEFDLALFSRWLQSQRVWHRIAEENEIQVLWLDSEEGAEAVARALDKYLHDDKFRSQLDQYAGGLTFRRWPTKGWPRPGFNQAPWVFVILGLVLLVALLTHLGQGGAILRAFLIVDPLDFPLTAFDDGGQRWNSLWEVLRQGEIWRLMSPGLLHFTVMHLVFNSLMFWFLGGQLEAKLGGVPLIVLVVLTSVVSNTAQYVDSGPVFGGLSGVVYGLVGYCWLLSRWKPRMMVFPPALMGFSLFWLVLGYTATFETLFQIKMANTAHLFGLISGLVLACLQIVLWKQKMPSG
ncbi:MAG: rhomboid family intramembrane serine protease [Hahellaceae bacterium]|nr:rhomboid family intramembrane serine protease [Hahellaceae bacterium]